MSISAVYVVVIGAAVGDMDTMWMGKVGEGR